MHSNYSPAFKTPHVVEPDYRIASLGRLQLSAMGPTIVALIRSSGGSSRFRLVCGWFIASGVANLSKWSTRILPSTICAMIYIKIIDNNYCILLSIWETFREGPKTGKNQIVIFKSPSRGKFKTIINSSDASNSLATFSTTNSRKMLLLFERLGKMNCQRK